ncbi:MAG: aminodeoxychorismate synthase component I [Candidatus Hydrogenedentes bacterium]|nr:aminodeoxychorismate synthase component I [Candidatus Hydrogenedentota bacterium]
MSDFGDITFVSTSRRRRFRRPVRVYETRNPAEARFLLDVIDAEVRSGYHAAGFLAYEAAPAFDPALQTHPPTELPVLWFGIYAQPDEGEAEPPGEHYNLNAWEPCVSEEDYRETVARLREWIAAGDTYQVNYTFPLRTAFHGSSLHWFHDLCEAQRADYCAHLNTGRFHIVSASPELFFELDGEMLRTKPMKGTAPRGRFSEEDRANANALRASIKDRAENVMIVDLLRNDMGRISRTGSVRVESLFDVERYPTVWQMTSTIASRTDAAVPEIFAALFPSGSVTGAPKVRTMEIIRAIERVPRGVYCGAVGWWGPERRASFNVAIRTAVIDTEDSSATYFVGSGITWDSSAEAEYAECLNKAWVLRPPERPFALLESLLFDGAYALLDLHLARLQESADYFGYPFDRGRVMSQLDAAARAYAGSALKVRLLLDRDGNCHAESAPAPETRRMRLGLATQAVDSQEVFLFHKTTNRTVYERARASRADCDDVLLWNERGEITESTVANVVLELDGSFITPPQTCGLLAGTFRAHLLTTGRVTERVVTIDDLDRCKAIHLINSVRGWISVEFVQDAAPFVRP